MAFTPSVAAPPPGWSSAPVRRRSGEGPLGLTPAHGLAAVGGVTLLSIALAFAVSQLDWKGQAVVVAALLVGLGALFVRQRALFLLVTLILSIQVLFHKAIGPLVTEATGGATGVYVNTVDAALAALYALWFLDGTLFRDVRRALRQPLFFVPLLGSLAVLPSVVMANNLALVLGELVRVFFAYALFVYVALRVRSRRDVAFVLGALALVVLTQFIVVVLQARTGSTLGLGALGAGGTESGALAPRTIEGGQEIPRPSGTVLHAILLGSLMAWISILALGLALNLRAWWLRVFWLGIMALGAAAVVLAMARAPALGMAVAVPLVTLVALRRRRLSLRALGSWLLLAALASAPFWNKLINKFTENVGTEHFWLEVEARLQLNQVALDMMNSSPLIGIGLNNTVTVLDQFEPRGVIYPGFPAHNLYLLVGSEAGIVGLAGLIVVFVCLLRAAVQLATVEDRFLSAVGSGITAVFVAVYVQELLVFSLRYDQPRTLFWLLAGLTVAGLRLARRERSERRGQAPAAAQPLGEGRVA